MELVAGKVVLEDEKETETGIENAKKIAIATVTDTAGGIVDVRMMTAEEEEGVAAAAVAAAAAAEAEAETITMSQQALVRIVEEVHQDQGPRQRLHPLPCSPSNGLPWHKQLERLGLGAEQRAQEQRGEVWPDEDDEDRDRASEGAVRGASIGNDLDE